MKFCDYCDNMLYPKVDDDTFKNYCKNCNTTFEREDKCVFKQNYDKKSFSSHSFINKYISIDPRNPRSNKIPCINEDCDTNTKGTEKEVIYMKYESDEMKFAYCCAVCKTTWLSSNE